MERNEFWRGREPDLFGIALGTAIGIGAAVPAPLQVRIAISLAIFVVCVWLFGRYPVIILRTVAAITQFNPTVIHFLGIIIAGGMAALVITSPGYSHNHSNVGPLLYTAAAAMASMLISLSAAALRYRYGFPFRALKYLLMYMIFDAASGVLSAGLVRAVFPDSWVAHTIYGAVIAGAIGSLLLRTQLSTFGPRAAHNVMSSLLDRDVDRSYARQRLGKVLEIERAAEARHQSAASIVQTARRIISTSLTDADVRTDALVKLDHIADNSPNLKDSMVKLQVLLLLSSYFDIDQVRDKIMPREENDKTDGRPNR